MRSSQLQRLLDVEYARRRKRYGRGARITQLKWLIATLCGLYLLLIYLRWSYPPPVSSVWIDGVRVEVVDAHVSDKIEPWLMRGAIVSAVVLFVTYLWSDGSNSESATSVSIGSGVGQDGCSCRSGETCTAHSTMGNTCNSVRGTDINASTTYMRSNTTTPSPLAVSRTATQPSSETTAQTAKLRMNESVGGSSSPGNILDPGRRAEQSARSAEMVQPEEAVVAATITTGATRPVGSSLPMHTAQHLHTFLQHKLEENQSREEELLERQGHGLPAESVFSGAPHLLQTKVSAAEAGATCSSATHVKQGGVALPMDGTSIGADRTSPGLLRVQYNSGLVERDTDSGRDAPIVSSNVMGGIVIGGAGVTATAVPAMAGALSSTGAAMYGGIAEEQWRALGVFHVDQCLGQVREWVSQVCLRVVDEVNLCNSLLAERQLSAFDCSHSLQEQVILTMPPNSTVVNPMMSSGSFHSSNRMNNSNNNVGNSASMGTSGWGVGVGSMTTSSSSAPWGATSITSAATSQAMTKFEAIHREKEMVRMQQQSAQDFDTLLLYERRLSLELRLDLNSTFPPDTVLTTSQLTERQQYVLHRLRTFAKQRTLASFRNGGSNSHFYREDFPQDAHLLLHVLRTSVEGMTPYIRFSYQRMSHTDTDLAIYAGDTGEPYFYVRYNTVSANKLYATHTGANSLFEALLIFAAIIRTHHNDMYGGIRGTMDLRRTEMLKFFR